MSRRRGFTLVELLICIGIIALLLSILLPALSRVKEKARCVQCLSNLRQLGMATIQYTIEFKCYPDTQSDNNPYNNWLRPDSFEDSALVRYIGAVPKVFRCPSDLDVMKRSYKYSYAYNSEFVLLQATKVTLASQKIVIVDDHLLNDNSFWYFATILNGWNDSTYDGLEMRHNQNTNGTVVFADGHADVVDSAHQNDPTYYEAYDGQGWVMK